MNRYPGIRPFRTEEQNLFFGRETDIERLHRLIDLEQTIILYGKSGYGKSSLLSAGIYPKLSVEEVYRHWEFRFGPFKGPDSVPPAQNMLHALQTGEANLQSLNALFPEENSLWLALKCLQSPGKQRFILFFDQFEELFTYPAEQVLAFKKLLAEALYSRVPKHLEKTIAAADLDPAIEDALYTPFELKVVFSIRADRMSLLNSLKDYLPNLLQHGYELAALDDNQAIQAITRPASLPQAEGYPTPPFQFAPETIAAILTALRDERGRIETSNLQIVCRYVEDNIVTPRAGMEQQLQPLTPEDLGDIKQIFVNFYESTVAGLAPDEQPVAHNLFENVLIKDGIRLPFAEQSLIDEPGVTIELLQKLASSSLLRVERDEQGRMIYEIGHDTLVISVMEAQKIRREGIEKEKLEQAKRRWKLARKAAIILVGFLLLFLVFTFGYVESHFSQISYLTSSSEKYLEKYPDLMLPQDKRDPNAFIAYSKANRANLYLRKSSERVDSVQTLLDSLQALPHANSNQIRRTQSLLDATRRDFDKAQQSAELVGYELLKEAKKDIFSLRYDAAWEKIQYAANLMENNRAIGLAYLEAGYIFNGSGNFDEAADAVKMAIPFFYEEVDADSLYKATDDSDLIFDMDKQLVDELKNRYFPKMIKVEGGDFLMGCGGTNHQNCPPEELPQHQVRVSDFFMARTEVTLWQYSLYCIAEKKDINDHHIQAWGVIRGSDPVIFVSWQDAVLYANWLSLRRGLVPVYEMDTMDMADFYRMLGTVDLQDSFQFGKVTYTNKIRPYANGFRLPTEAEWEYAAKGGRHTRLTPYAGGLKLNSVGWYDGNSTRTQPVAGKAPNALGIFDLSGNVREWCWDWQGDYPSGSQINPTGPPDGGFHVARGGSWFTSANFARVISRDPWRPDEEKPDEGSYEIGIRLVQNGAILPYAVTFPK